MYVIFSLRIFLNEVVFIKCYAVVVLIHLSVFPRKVALSTFFVLSWALFHLFSYCVVPNICGTLFLCTIIFLLLKRKFMTLLRLHLLALISFQLSLMINCLLRKGKKINLATESLLTPLQDSCWGRKINKYTKISYKENNKQ